MTDAIYVASRNFSNTFYQATKIRHNPLRMLRKSTESLAKAAQDDKPVRNIYRHGVGGHLFRVAVAGPRWGAGAGSFAAGAVHGLVSSVRKGLTSKTERVERTSNISRRTVASVTLGIAGTVLGAVSGLALKSVEHAAVTSFYLVAMALGAAVGSIGLPIAAVYAIYVLSSSDKRAELAAQREVDNLAAAKLCALPDNDSQAADFAKDTLWEDMAHTPVGLPPVRVG